MDYEMESQPKRQVLELEPDFLQKISGQNATLTTALQGHYRQIFAPGARKTIRPFTPAETSTLLGINENYLRQILSEDPTIPRTMVNARLNFSVHDLHEIRTRLDKRQAESKTGRRRTYLPHRGEAEELQIIAVMNFKGGSGKTTTTAHLAQYLALQGYRVLAIDLDPQASLSALFGHQPELDVGPDQTLYGAIRYDDRRRPISDIVRATYIPNLHIIPANLELMEFEHETPRWLMTKNIEEAPFSQIANAIRQCEQFYDVILVDSPPSLGFLTLSALTAATAIIITLHPQMLDVLSMRQFLQMVEDLLTQIWRVDPGNKSKWMKYLFTRFEPSDGPQNQMAGFLRSLFNDDILIHPMLKSTAISDAGLTNQTIYEVDRQQFTKSTYDRALEAMNNVNQEIKKRIHQAWGRAL